MKANNIQKIVEEAKKIVKRKDAEIKLLKSELKQANGEKTVLFKMPDSMQIENFPEISKVEIVNHKEISSVNVLNLKELQKDIQAVEIKNHPEIQKVHVVNSEKAPDVQKVEVTNQEKSTVVEWVPAIITSSVKSLGDLWIKLWTNGITVRLDDSERLKPIPVYLVDEKGRPIKEPRGTGGEIRYGLNLPMIGRGNQIAPPTSIRSGRIVISTPGTPVQLSSGQACKKVIFSTIPGNGGVIAIGASNVSAQSGSENGSLLMPTGSATIDIDNASKLYIDGTNIGDVITYNILV